MFFIDYAVHNYRSFTATLQNKSITAMINENTFPIVVCIFLLNFKY